MEVLFFVVLEEAASGLLEADHVLDQVFTAAAVKVIVENVGGKILWQLT